MQIIPEALFPSMVWTTLFDDREAFNASLLQRALALRASDPAGVQNTNVHGWQSPNILQNLPEFNDINLRILQICDRIGESLNFRPGVQFMLQS